MHGDRPGQIRDPDVAPVERQALGSPPAKLAACRVSLARNLLMPKPAVAVQMFCPSNVMPRPRSPDDANPTNVPSLARNCIKPEASLAKNCTQIFWPSNNIKPKRANSRLGKPVNVARTAPSVARTL